MLTCDSCGQQRRKTKIMKRIEQRLFSDELNSSVEIRRSPLSLSLWLPFLECLWNWLDFVTPHPMTVPVHSEPELNLCVTHRMFCIKVHWGSIDGLKVFTGKNTAPHAFLNTSSPAFRPLNCFHSQSVLSLLSSGKAEAAGRSTLCSL